MPVTYRVVVEPEIEKNKLSTLSVSIDTKTGYASWNSIKNAVSYVYVIDNGEPISTNALSIKLAYMQSIKVMAIGNGINYSNSDYSATKTLTTQVFDSNYYGGGKNGKSMLTIGVKTWTYGAPEETQ